MHVAVKDIDIHYELTGNYAAPVVVLSHSLATTMRMWDPQRKVLSKHFRVLRYDMRGHGASGVSRGDYTLEQLADDVAALLDALSLTTVHFVGLSIGGMIAQALALNHGDRLQSLTLCDTMAVMPAAAKPVFESRMQTARRKGMHALVDETLERWFTPGYLASRAPAVEAIRRQVLATPVMGYVGCGAAILGLDYADRLSQIDLPTLVMVGAQDPGTPVAAARGIHDAIKGSRLEVIESASHLVNIEQETVFNRILLSFLTAADNR